MRLPGSAGAVAVGAPHGVFAPCLGGPLALSPFDPLRTLEQEITGMGVTTVPPPFAASAAAEPPACRAAALRREPGQHGADWRPRFPRGAPAAHRRAAMHAG